VKNEYESWNDSVDSFYRQLLFRSQYAARKACVRHRYAPNSFLYDTLLSATFLVLAVAAGFIAFSFVSGALVFHDALSAVIGALIESCFILASVWAVSLTNRGCWHGELEWRNIYLPEGPRDPALDAAIAQVTKHTLHRRIRLVEFRHVCRSFGQMGPVPPEERCRIREKEILFRALEFTFGGEKCWLEVDPPIRQK